MSPCPADPQRGAKASIGFAEGRCQQAPTSDGEEAFAAVQRGTNPATVSPLKRAHDAHPKVGEGWSIRVFPVSSRLLFTRSAGVGGSTALLCALSFCSPPH